MLGLCSYCGLAFCIECRKVWHGGSRCQTVVDKWLKGTPDERAELEKRCVCVRVRVRARERVYVVVGVLMPFLVFLQP